MTLTIRSPSFSENEKIPDKHAKGGRNLSPELHMVRRTRKYPQLRASGRGSRRPVRHVPPLGALRHPRRPHRPARGRGFFGLWPGRQRFRQ